MTSLVGATASSHDKAGVPPGGTTVRWRLRALRHHRLTRPVALTIAIAALAAPAPAAAADPAARAVHVRSQALNERYGLGGTTSQSQRALHLRSQALNDRYAADRTPRSPDTSSVRTPSGEASSRDPVDSTDAGIGAGVIFVGLGLISLSIYAVVQRRRTDPTRRRPAKAA